MVRAVPPGDTPVSEMRVRLPPGVIRKVMALVDVVVPSVSFSMRMIFSRAVVTVSGSMTKDTDAVPRRVVLADEEYLVDEYQTPVSLTFAVAGMFTEPVTTS
jgi:hypothetical protein